jgi:hypothetical protein
MDQALDQEPTPTNRRALRYRRLAATYAVATGLLFLAPGPVLVLAALAAAVKLFELPLVFAARRRRLPHFLRAAGYRLGFLLFAVILTGVNMDLAEARLDRLVDAVHAYHATHGAYPERLEDLAPDYIQRVPRATLWLTMNRFHWKREGLLTCVPSPPIGWIGYDFRTDKRVAMD